MTRLVLFVTPPLTLLALAGANFAANDGDLPIFLGCGFCALAAAVFWSLAIVDHAQRCELAGLRIGREKTGRWLQ